MSDLVRPTLVGLLATVVTLVNVTHVSMWVDEGATISAATRPLPDLWRMLGTVDAVHGLYDVMMHPWLALTGTSELAVRLPSALATGLAAAGVVVLTTRLTGPSAGVAAGLVFAVLPRVSWMGIEGRSYALTATVAVWSTVLLLGLLRRPTWPRHVAYALLAAFGCALNIFLLLLLAAHGVALLLDRRARFTRVFWTWLAAGAVGALGGLPVLVAAVGQSGQIGDNPAGVADLLRQVLVNQWFLGATPTRYLPGGGGTLLEGVGSQAWKPAAVGLAALCWALVAYAVVRPVAPAGHAPLGYRGLLLSWLAVPTLVLVGYSVAATPLYNPRYLTFAAPAVAALVGIALVGLRRLPGRWRWLAPVAAVLVVTLALPVYASQRTRFAKAGADWKQVADFVVAHPGPNPAVYYAPRVPPVDGRVTTTSRTAQTLYPEAFAGMVDLTLLTTPAAAGDLVGRSQLLSESTDRLTGVETVYAITRVDASAEVLAADEAVLTGVGFRPADRWAGPLNTVVVYTR